MFLMLFHARSVLIHVVGTFRGTFNTHLYATPRTKWILADFYAISMRLKTFQCPKIHFSRSRRIYMLVGNLRQYPVFLCIKCIASVVEECQIRPLYSFLSVHSLVERAP